MPINKILNKQINDMSEIKSVSGTFFECKVRYEKTEEDGKQKKVTEPYIVDAMSFTEAEARIIEEVTPYISGEFSVDGIKRCKFTEIILDEKGDLFYKTSICLITLDEKSGKEKKTKVPYLVQATSLEQALENLKSFMKGSLCDYSTFEGKETNIIDVVTPKLNGK